MKSAKLLAVFLSASMIALSLVSCGNSDVSAPQENAGNTAVESDTTVPDEEQVLTLVNLDSKILDVNDVTNYHEFILLSHVQEGLFRVLPNEKGDPVLTNA